jgi:alkylhydroperoxidase family enzyme
VARIDIPDGEGIERRRLWQLAPEIGAAVHNMGEAVYTKTTLDVQVREVARMRIAQINRCHI